ncbi:alpha/beta fold hydrolase [Sediminibacillus dalangtanensis]|uniref:Alpha/beta fold hydrolase n=1 Tax=Sediminibacillus dalangtanensis TaxID=2729421 RepID=A0ABX7VSJ7_9BACI|nr:alpha/beta hydrolase [Sediminibacillus dalangtanensis]QTM98979.1 alpha/beta fold hydrolase [Sediminibacillus dalangtanensis]
MKKRIGWITGGIVVLLTVALLGGSNYFYNQGVNRGEQVELYSEEPPVLPSSEADRKLLAEAQDWFAAKKLKELEMTSYDGLNLKAHYLQNPQESGKAVILAHGYRGYGQQMGDLAKFYYDHGFSILMPDARGHGESEGDYIGYGWHDRLDYQGWIKRLIDDYRMDSIFLHGNSMGAALVLMTSGEDLPSQVKGIIADSGYTDVSEELSHQLRHLYHLPAFPLISITSGMTKLRAGYWFGEASAIEQVKDNTRPLFIIHGDRDELVPTEMAHRLYEAADSEKQLWIVPGAGHTDAYAAATAEFQKRLEAFIESALGF